MSDLAQGMRVTLDKTEAGVIVMKGRQSPSVQLRKIAGGQPGQLRRPEATMLSLVGAELQEMMDALLRAEKHQDERDVLRRSLAVAVSGRAAQNWKHLPLARAPES